MPNAPLRKDLQLIADQITAGSRLLDVGCADGDLLHYLREEKQVEGRGLELEVENVNACVAKGLFVVQGDADADLSDYSDQSFDYVVLSRTLQAVHRPNEVLEELLRIGRKAIVTIPNFGHWKIRRYLLLHGSMPVTADLPDTWFETQNIHLCTIKDMFHLVDTYNYKLEKFVPVTEAGNEMHKRQRMANLLAAQALFVLSKG